ncbi:MAG: DegT/DnrJ/EryC1/StrS family aminotransferase, partial [Coleofasciculus sp. C2-GNP5-27]
LRDWTEARRTRAAYYEELLKGLPVKVPMQAPGAKAVYHLYVVQVERRDACLAYLRDNGVMVQVHYPAPVHFQPCYRNLGYKKGDLPVAEAACGRILSLPMYPELTDNQIRTVVETLKAFFETT